MERSEPTLVPEWLKGTTGSNHSVASSLQSDPFATLPMRSRSSAGLGDHDTPRSSAFQDRTSSSSYFRRSSSSNGSMNHDKDPSAYSSWPYSSFGRNHRDRDWDKDLDVRDKERSSSLLGGDHRVYDYSDSLTISSDILTSRIEKDSLRRSQSMVSGKRGEVWPRRAGKDANNGSLVGTKIVSSVHKTAFERDFPSLGTEEKQGVPDIGRVSSPVLSSTATQSLSMGTSAVVIGGDGWTSALAEVPVIITNSNTLLSSVQQPASSSSAMLLSTATGLNMAETLAQAPSRARSDPQLSVETQRLEELAIKQSRQLIPMTPKTSVLNSTEKPKPKTARTGELSAMTKVGQQCPSSQVVNHPLRGPTSRSDTVKASQAGKLFVLKAVRETNGVSTISPSAKDVLSPTNSGRVVNNLLGVAPSPAFTGSRGPINPKLPADRKPAASSVTQMCLDKRPLSQAQNRSDFFNSLRKKTVSNSTATIPELSTVVDKSGEQQIVGASVSHEKDVSPTSDSGLDCFTGNASSMAGNVEEPQRILNEGEKSSSSDEVVDPDEEEAAFLRSLGWEENAAEDEALTEEEINAFYKEYMKLRPSSKLGRGLQHVKIAPLESHVGSLDAASGLSSSDAESDAV